MEPLWRYRAGSPPLARGIRRVKSGIQSPRGSIPSGSMGTPLSPRNGDLYFYLPVSYQRVFNLDIVPAETEPGQQVGGTEHFRCASSQPSPWTALAATTHQRIRARPGRTDSPRVIPPQHVIRITQLQDTFPWVGPDCRASALD